ncbi:uncharacterized protein G2W53_029190 [Senna tora]|uniref:Uncharacterized protein n=1 Tax=Senna tora TaxID=362788 RepID=A0A834T6Q9_9FABA|nr:uncharacterized protein G2W53_029190 [Senna tora]
MRTQSSCAHDVAHLPSSLGSSPPPRQLHLLPYHARRGGLWSSLNCWGIKEIQVVSKVSSQWNTLLSLWSNVLRPRLCVSLMRRYNSTTSGSILSLHPGQRIECSSDTETKPLMPQQKPSEEHRWWRRAEAEEHQW